MAVENCLLARTLTASGNGLSADTDQFIFVQPGSTEKQVSPAVVNGNICGITQGTSKTGEGISIAMVGISKIRLGGTVSHGNLLKSDANGNAVAHLGLGNHGAMALADGVSGEVIESLILIGRPSGA